MTVYLSDLRDQLQHRLGDTNEAIWPSSELDDYVKEGYNALTMATGCLWATDVAPDFAFAFTHTSPFEAAYFQGGWTQAGCAQFTSEFERDYIDNAVGPANHTQHWEYNDGYVTAAGASTEISPIVDLPEELHEIERATWDSRRIEPLPSRWLEQNDPRYELNKGQVNNYAQDKDGLRRLRKWQVPSAAYEPYELDDDDEVWGVLIQIPDVTSSTPIGQWGDFVQVPGEHAIGDQWGVIVGVYKETSNMRMEYRRRGAELTDSQPFEIPDRYTVYVRHYAQARALEREGDGQDLELAAHYDARYKAGVQRMLKRKQAVQFQRKYVIGGNADRPQRQPLVRLPWQYGVMR